MNAERRNLISNQLATLVGMRKFYMHFERRIGR